MSESIQFIFFFVFRQYLGLGEGEKLSASSEMSILWLSFAGLGIAIGVLISRWKVGIEIWNESRSSIIQSSFGMAACGAILLTASVGGKFTRGESLLDILHFEILTYFSLMTSLT